MFFLLLVSILFRRPLPFLILVSSNGGRGEIKIVSASTPSTNEQPKNLILVHTVQLKPMIKAQISGRMISSGISDVVIASVHSRKTRLKNCMMIMIIIIMNKSQDTTFFSGRQKLTSAMKLRPEK